MPHIHKSHKCTHDWSTDWSGTVQYVGRKHLYRFVIKCNECKERVVKDILLPRVSLIPVRQPSLPLGRPAIDRVAMLGR